MIERELLEREIHQLRQIIRADTYALASKSTPIGDRARLQKQIAIRTTMWVGLSKELSGDSSLGTARGGPVACDLTGPRGCTSIRPAPALSAAGSATYSNMRHSYGRPSVASLERTDFAHTSSAS
jgi:hypothetical protein